MFSEGETIRVKENGGEYLAKLLNKTDYTDPDGNQLYRVKVTEIIEQTNHKLNEGETCNTYPRYLRPKHRK
jgi:hypothetical protein